MSTQVEIIYLRDLIQGWILLVILAYTSMALGIKWLANRFNASANPFLKFLSQYCAIIWNFLCNCFRQLLQVCFCGCKCLIELIRSWIYQFFLVPPQDKLVEYSNSSISVNRGSINLQAPTFWKFKVHKLCIIILLHPNLNHSKPSM